MHLVNRLWYRHRLPYYAKPLLLFSAIYRVIVLLRRCYYHVKKISPVGVPIIVVGNLTVGGAGKTPLVAWLAQQLTRRGYSPGIVSRGYGGNATQYPCVVTQHSKASEVGDEPLMLHLQTQCPVVVDPKRLRAVNKLLTDTRCNVVISDDGLQHLNLPRDLEIVVLDGVRRFGNGCCLPAGPLREPIAKMRQVNYVVTNGIAQHPEIAMRLRPKPIVSLCRPRQSLMLRDLQSATITIHAVAAIGFPERFFQSLKEQGLTVVPHAFPDHHRYQLADFAFLGPQDVVLMTEKDAVKCREFADQRFYCQPVEVADSDELVEMLRGVIDCAVRRQPY